MEREKFEKLVEEALAQLPRKFKKLIHNLAVIVEEAPSPDVYRKTGVSSYSMILGTYHGVPYKHRGPYYGNTPPDMIVIYQKPIEATLPYWIQLVVTVSCCCSLRNLVRKRC